MAESEILRFRCRLVSPFHTTQHLHQNLARSAPYILGSSLRGVLLSYLIQTNYSHVDISELAQAKAATEIQSFHRNYSDECVLKSLAGETEWLPVFTFGMFQDHVRALRHRVGIDRRSRTVAVGRIVSIEVVPEGTEFEFSVVLPSSALAYKSQIVRAVRDVGRELGVGHYKSLGFGRFEVGSPEEVSLAVELERIHTRLRDLPGQFSLGIATPLVLENAGKPLPLRNGDFGLAFARLLAERYEEIHERFQWGTQAHAEAIFPRECAIAFRPGYISRSSFEQGTRKNALVALPGNSSITVSYSQSAAAPRWQLAVAELLGIGTWADAGFGRLKADLTGGGGG